MRRLRNFRASARARGATAGNTHFYVQLRDALRNPASLEAGVDLRVTFAALGGSDGSSVPARKRQAVGGGGVPRSMESFVCRGKVIRPVYRASVSVTLSAAAAT